MKIRPTRQAEPTTAGVSGERGPTRKAGAATGVLLCAGLVLAGCSLDSDDDSDDKEKDYSMSGALSSARDGDYSEAICAAANLYVNASEASQERMRKVGESVVNMASDTEWASSGDNSRYISLGDALFSAGVNVDGAKNDSMRTSVDALC